MLPDLKTIKELRTNLGLSQRQLAKKLNLSAAMINQVESGTTQPSYDTARRIFEYLFKSITNQVKIGVICHKEPITLTSTHKIIDAIKKMHDNEISQIPIVEKEICKGIITEEKLTQLIDNDEINKSTPLKEVMDSPPPSFDYDYPATPLRILLRYSKCILVTKNGKIYGIVTHQDFNKLL